MKREKVKRRVSLEFKVLYPFFAVPSSSISGKLAGCPQERCSRHCAREGCLRFDYEEAAERKWFIRSPNRARPTPLLLRLLIRISQHGMGSSPSPPPPSPSIASTAAPPQPNAAFSRYSAAGEQRRVFLRPLSFGVKTEDIHTSRLLRSKGRRKKGKIKAKITRESQASHVRNTRPPADRYVTDFYPGAAAAAAAAALRESHLARVLN